MSNPSKQDMRWDLSSASVLIVQNNEIELDVVGQVFIGFGVRVVRKCVTLDAADGELRRQAYDMLVIDSDMPNGAAYDFISNLRRREVNPNRTAPILLVSGHTVPANVERARDCGANFVVVKPITPAVLFERVTWLAKESRQFIVSGNYCGPDRRHKTYGPPPGMKGRRHDDLSAHVGTPVGPDLSQTDIDSLMTPKRIAL